MVSNVTRPQIFKFRWLCAYTALMGVVSLTGCSGCISNAEVDGIADQVGQQVGNAADEISKVGKLQKKAYPPYGEAYVVDLTGATITDQTFDQLAQLQRVSELVLAGSTITDAHAERLNGMGGVLIKLDLSKTEFSDAGLAQLNSLLLLRELNVAGTKVTAAGIAKFSQERAANKAILEMFRQVRITK